MLSSQTTIILASSSPRRLQLLSSIGFQVVSIEPNVDETRLMNEHPKDMVLRLAKLKANSININTNTNPIIAADTIVCLGENILGKPKDKEDAIAMLTLLSGKTHQVMTGYCIKKGNTEMSDFVITQVSFRDLSDKEIALYIDTKEPFDKAGAYGIQGIGACLIDHVEGSYTNVMGLPLKEILEKIGH